MNDATDDAMHDATDEGVGEPDPVWEARVRAALADPLPVDVAERSAALWELDGIDAELAELIAEEWSDAELAGVRSAMLQVTAFTFAAGDVTIELECDGDVVSGQLHPGVQAPIELRGQRGAGIDGATNSVGTFELPNPGAGSWCLLVRLPDGPVRTPWFTL
jgi:hypothetical protein